MTQTDAPMRVASVDDEPMARARLQRLLARQAALRIVGEFGDGRSAADALRELACDVVFLDIRMPEVDGFAMLEALPPGRRPLVVFVTAYAGHALRACDAWAVDYLMKPVSEARLIESLARVRRLMQGRNDVDRHHAQGRYPERLAVPDGARVHVIPSADIELVLARGNSVELRVGGRGLLLRETMHGVEQRLDPRLFLRAHRSRIVRIDMIEQIEPCAAGQYSLRLSNGMRVTSGRSYREQLLRAYGMAA